MGKIKLNIDDLFNIPTAEIFNPDSYKPVNSVSIDSRNIKKNSLFVAIKGKFFDGHNFIHQAIKNGASVVVINKRRVKDFQNLSIPFVAVNNTTFALGELAKVWRNKLTAKVISLTGSSGKTSTKEILTLLLEEKYKVQKTIQNNNNNIGVPITIFSSNEKDDILVMEHGTNHFGEIAYSAGLAMPDYALITNIGPAHLEYFKSTAGVVKEKSALFAEAEKNNGIVFINTDDEHLTKYSKKYTNVVTYGFQGKPDIKGKIKSYLSDGRILLEVSFKNKKFEVILPLYGETSAKNILAAVAVVLKTGMNKKEIVTGISKLKPVNGRLNIIRRKNTIVIDDTYNANPASMKSLFDLIGKISTYTKKAVFIGDMLELGDKAINYHKQLSVSLEKNKIREVYTYGKNMASLNGVLSKKKNISVRHFRSANSLIKFLEKYDCNETVIGFKGSRKMQMERFVQHLLTGTEK